MPYNPNIHNRRSIRLKRYDYTQAGMYFITICCHDKNCLFGKIIGGNMLLNDAGIIADQCWLDIPNHFKNVVLHQHIIMPNHVHGIIELVGANQYSPHETNQHNNKNTGVINTDSPDAKNQHNNTITENIDIPNKTQQLPVNTIGAENISPGNQNAQLNNIIGIENISTNNVIGANVDSPLPQSPSKTVGSVVRGFKIGMTKWMRQNTNTHNVWQRNYYENIIRDEKSFDTISAYIINNPKKMGRR